MALDYKAFFVGHTVFKALLSWYTNKAAMTSDENALFNK